MTHAIAQRRDELLTVQEFAALVRMHPLSIYRLVRAGRQPGACRVGREIRIDIAVALRPTCIHTSNSLPLTAVAS